MGNERILARQRRHRRVRKKVSGRGDRPRLSICKSLQYIYAQLIDDTTEPLPAAGLQGAHQVAQVIWDGAQADNGVDEHRKEDDQGADQNKPDCGRRL